MILRPPRYTMPALRRPAGPARRPVRFCAAAAAFACALGLACADARADNWATIAEIPVTHVQISMDPTSIARPDAVNLSWLRSLTGSRAKDSDFTHAWFLFDFAAPVTTAESFVYRSYARREIIDCKTRASTTEAYTAYSDPRGTGRLIYTWTGPNAVVPQLTPAAPGSVEGIMIDAACAPPAPPPEPPAPASAPTAPAAQVPADSVPGAPAAPIPSLHGATQTLQ